MNLRKFGLITLIASMGTAAFGASIDHIQNYTAEYNANMAQQGAISATTSVYYNPAGLMRLKNGTYFTGGVQLAIGEETMKYDTKHDGNSHTYDADLLAPIPNFALFKKDDNRAYFWTFGGIAGGGDLEYKNGVAGITVLEDAIQNTPLKQMGNTVIMGSNAKDNGSWAEGENMYGQTTLGMAWNVNSKLSLSVAGRVVYGWRNLKAKLDANLDLSSITIDQNGNPASKQTGLGNYRVNADIDSERTAWGFGGQFGLNYAYNDTWNFAMRYDTKIKMEFEADATSHKANILGQETPLGFEMFFPQYADGTKFRRDLPAILAVGASQKVTDKWTMFYGANYYFNESAKIDKDVVYTNLVTGEKETGIEYDNGWELSLGTEYWLNEKWAVLGGVNYAKTGAKAESYSDVEFALDSFLVGMGVKYRPDEDTEWVVSTSHYFYESSDGTFDKKYPGRANAQRYDKNISSIGFSYTKKF